MNQRNRTAQKSDAHEFSAMNDAQVHRELACDPAKMFIAVGIESIESEFANVIDRMESQL